MKKLLLLAFFLGLSLTGISAEEYQAPKLDFNKKLKNGWKGKEPKKVDWENNYRVQDRPEAERNLASDEEENRRDPSSQPQKIKEWKGPKIWHYNPNDEE